MKRFITTIILFFLFIIPGRFLYAEEIKFFDVHYVIDRNGSVHVTERIEYDFGTDYRHGIFRTIPTIKRNAEGKQYKMSFDNVQVTKDSVVYPFSIDKSQGQIELKIGDPDKKISGIQEYIISYTVRGALTYFSDHDEFYWNVTGNEWNIPINRVRASLQLPEEINLSSIQLMCFTGLKGSNDQNCTIDHQTKTITTSRFSPQEGLTVVLGFPRGIVAVVEPELVTNIFENPFVLIGIFLTAFAWYIVLPFWIGIRWWKRGRDPKSIVGQAHVSFSVPTYPSKRPMTPAELGFLLREYVEPKTITATIIDLAHKGYVLITKEKHNEFTLSKIPKQTESLVAHEKLVYDKLFKDNETISSKSLNLFQTYQTIKTDIAKESVKQGLFVKNPELQRNLYIGLSIIALATGNMLLFISSLVFGKNMPQRTQLGVDMKAMGEALKTFLVSQKHQMTFQAKELFLFEKLLPYASALGVEKVWAERFKDAQVPQPDWYQGNETFNTLLFVNSLNSSFRSVESRMSTTSSSTGHSSGFSGGFSGGGGGGGGGGSW